MDHRRPTLFVGLGSPHGDDQIGWRIADELAQAADLPASINIRKAAVPLDVLDWSGGIETLHLCDAAETSAAAGELNRWDWQPGRDVSRKLLPILERRSARGSHDFELPAVLDLMAQLNPKPPRIVVWTISATRFEPGESLSEELEQALPRIAATIVTFLHAAEFSGPVSD